MNVILKGRARQVVEEMVDMGYANTKSEAVRLAIINFGEKQLSEAELVRRKLDQMDREVVEGKRRLLTPEEAMGKYAKGIK